MKGAKEDPVVHRVVQWGTGSTGRLALRLLIEHPERELIGLGVHSPDKEGCDAAELCGLDTRTGVTATRDLDALLALRPDCFVYMGTEYAGRPDGAVIDDLCRILEAGINVVNTALPNLVWPRSMGTAIANRLEDAAARGGASVFTTGVEPGYLADALPLTLTSLSARVDSVRIEQRIDETNYREELEALPFGPGATLEDDAAHCPAGLGASVWRGVLELFAAGMQIELDEIREIREVAPAPTDIPVGRSTIAKGRVAGVRLRIQGIKGGEAVIEIDRQDVYGPDTGKDLGWPQPLPGRQMTRHSRIIIEGSPRIDAEIDLSESDEAPTLSGMLATAARVVNSIPWVVDAGDGVLTNLDLAGITGAGTLRPR
jgi:hypothetical protein